MNNEINDTKKFTIKNPDGEFITFYKVPHSPALAILDNCQYKKDVYSIYGVDLNVFLLKDGRVLFEKTIDRSYYLLFDTKVEYDKFVSGKSYWRTYVDFYRDEAYSSFLLECDITDDLIKKSIKSDVSYKISGNTGQYILYYLPDGSVCYLIHRVKDWYDGYWYSSFDQFKYIYNNILK